MTATPIGNLGDITYRAVETLRSVDVILCEDTRLTARLCEAYQITTMREAYHDHNGAQRRPVILDRLREGASMCLVSDAGTPLINDPGYKLVREALAAGISVTTLPGPCAAIAALSIAGLPSDAFSFAGFPPQKSAARQSFFRSWINHHHTVIFYETAGRLANSLHDLQTVMGNNSKLRNMVIARELTKKFETLLSGTVSSLVHKCRDMPLKGEIVLLLEGANPVKVDDATLDAAIVEALKTLRVKEVAAAIADQFSLPRKEVYARALTLKDHIPPIPDDPL